MYAFGVCEPRVVTVVSCVLKVSYFIHRDFTLVTGCFLDKPKARINLFSLVIEF